MLWVLGIMLIVFNGETLWVRWSKGSNYRHIKATMGSDPIARSIVKSTAQYYEIHPLHVFGFSLGVLLILIAALGG
tara:strand:+ start:172 stop:399 length:228 start_codon:yes stop_codon:yes gene_type:complete